MPDFFFNGVDKNVWSGGYYFCVIGMYVCGVVRGWLYMCMVSVYLCVAEAYMCGCVEIALYV